MNRARRIPAAGLGCILVLAGMANVQARPPVPRPDPFIVHEWGTFSTFSGSDGVLRRFTPNDRDLPGFVHNQWEYSKGSLPLVLVSLETPVLYFYSDRERTASVRVDFPGGQLTEWYPHTSRPPLKDRLTWEDVRILPRGRSLPLPAAGTSRYAAAREADACIVQVMGHDDKWETEKMFFYRGIGSPALPLTVRAEGNGHFRVCNAAREPLAAFLLLRVSKGSIGMLEHGPLAGRAEVALQEPAESAPRKKVAAAMERLLMDQGLFPREARAMVRTWQADWFDEEGVRVLYLLPPTHTDRLLPLRIQPAPDQRLRVLVGRHDVLTPEREQQIDGVVRDLVDGSKRQAEAAEQALARLGRYRWAAQEDAQRRVQACKNASQASR